MSRRVTRSMTKQLESKDDTIDEDGELKPQRGYNLTIRELEDCIRKLNDSTFKSNPKKLWDTPMVSQDGCFINSFSSKEEAIEWWTKLLNKRKERKEARRKLHQREFINYTLNC